MFNIGGGEVLVIALVALIVLGPDRLPDAARRVGSFLGELRKMSDGFQSELRSAMEVPDEPVVKPKSGPGLAAVTDLNDRKSPKTTEPPEPADDEADADSVPAAEDAGSDPTDEPAVDEDLTGDEHLGEDHGHGDAATG
jgi:sec-independent protein translocase protein TatB